MGLEEKARDLLQDERNQETKKMEKFAWIMVWVNVVGPYFPSPPFSNLGRIVGSYKYIL